MKHYEARLTVMVSALATEELAIAANERCTDLLLETHDSGHPGDIVIGAEIREYDEETDVSGAFFEDDTTYLRKTRNYPYTAPEDVPEFECVTVQKNPSTGELVAMGWGRPGSEEDFHLSACSQKDWDKGWIVKPEPVSEEE